MSNESEGPNSGVDSTATYAVAVRLTANGTLHSLTLGPRSSLLDVLRVMNLV
jgi:hypothetical protein